MNEILKMLFKEILFKFDGIEKIETGIRLHDF